MVIEEQLSHLCVNGVPIEGDPCPLCQEWAAERVEQALEEPDPLDPLRQATGEDLDRLAANYGITRKAGTEGYGPVTDVVGVPYLQKLGETEEEADLDLRIRILESMYPR